MEQLNRYRVTYHTQPAPGATFYRGAIAVWAEDDEDAADRARREVHRQAFRDWNLNHIVIDEVTRVWK